MVEIKETAALIALGMVVATPGVLDEIPDYEIHNSLCRHKNGDWGVLDKEDKIANDEAVKCGNRILSAYIYENTKYWIITEWDRSVTTVLLPSEY